MPHYRERYNKTTDPPAVAPVESDLQGVVVCKKVNFVVPAILGVIYMVPDLAPGPKSSALAVLRSDRLRRRHNRATGVYKTFVEPAMEGAHRCQVSNHGWIAPIQKVGPCPALGNIRLHPRINRAGRPGKRNGKRPDVATVEKLKASSYLIGRHHTDHSRSVSTRSGKIALEGQGLTKDRPSG